MVWIAYGRAGSAAFSARGLDLANQRSNLFFSFSARASEGLWALKDLVEAGTIKPVIDRIYPLEETAEDHRYVETGQKKGSVVIRVE